MRKISRLTSLFIIGAAMTLSMAFMSYADEINSIRLSFSGEQPEEGGSVGDISVTTDSSEYFVRAAGYVNDEMNWESGDTPRVRVEIYTSDDNSFNCTGKSHFHLSGMGASYKSAGILDNGTALELNVTLSRIDGDLSETGDVWWDGMRARWDDVDDAEKYEVALYRNDSRVTTEKTSSTSYNFSSSMDRNGDYYFRIRAISDDDKGSWSDYSDTYSVSENSNAGSSPEHSSTCSNSAGWQHDSHGWWYRYPDGSYEKNNWLLLNGSWYLFDANGYMHTGWAQWKNNWYYLSSSGAMLANTTTPDGFYVNQDGVWVQNPRPQGPGESR